MDMKAVTSSNIDSIGYDVKNSLLYVKFKSGKSYSYEQVPQRAYDLFLSAPSKGEYFGLLIKDNYKTNNLGTVFVSPERMPGIFETAFKTTVGLDERWAW